VARAVWCKTCLTLAKVIPIEPILSTGKLQYCPYCGMGAEVVDQPKIWGFLAERFNLPEALIREIFAAWSCSDVPNFEDYVRQIVG